MSPKSPYGLLMVTPSNARYVMDTLAAGGYDLCCGSGDPRETIPVFNGDRANNAPDCISLADGEIDMWRSWQGGMPEGAIYLNSTHHLIAYLKQNPNQSMSYRS